MSRIEGRAGSWPPLRISYADGQTTNTTAETALPAKASDREQDLSAILEQRLNSTLSQIRDSVRATRSGAYANPQGGQPAAATDSGSRLDVLA